VLSTANALVGQAAVAVPQGGGSGFANQMLLLAIICIIFYFLLIRPQLKQNKERRLMLEALKKGDKVMTSGGLYGRIMDMDGDVVDVEIAERVKIKINRQHVAGLADPGEKAPQAGGKKGKDGSGKDDKKGK
jgi:preprotein translocase subunit YajC